MNSDTEKKIQKKVKTYMHKVAHQCLYAGENVKNEVFKIDSEYHINSMEILGIY